MDTNTLNFKGAIPGFALGLLALGSQIGFIRLLLDVFQGNELTIGLAFSFWFAGSALGAAISGRGWTTQSTLPVILFLIFPVLTGFTVLLKITPLLFHIIPGTYPSLTQSMIILMIALWPVAFFIGALFPVMVTLSRTPSAQTDAAPINRTYIWESLGSFTAALMIDLVLFHYFNHMQVIFICLLLFYGLLGLLPLRRLLSGEFLLLTILSGILVLTGSSISVKLEQDTYPAYRIIAEKTTPYGHIRLMKLGEQTIILNQGNILYNRPDPFSSESRALLPLLLTENPRNVLWIGGDLFSAIPLLKQFPSLRQMTYLDVDPFLVKLQRDSIENAYSQLPFGIQFVTNDARRFLTASDSQKFDLICLNQPEPHTLNFNRFYSLPFFRIVKNHLTHGGVFFFSIRSSENYMNKSLARYISVLQNSLGRVFPAVLIVPGDYNHFAAGEQLPADPRQALIHRLRENGIHPLYFTPVYLNYRLSEERQLFFNKQLSRWQTPEINTDFNLRGYFYHFLTWGNITSGFLPAVADFLNSHRTIILFLLTGLLLIVQILFRFSDSGWVLQKLFFMGGFAISLEIVLILEYQIFYGNVYYRIALIIGLFMLGLAAGAALPKRPVTRPENRQDVRKIYLAIILVTMALTLPVPAEQAILKSPVLYPFFEYFYFPVLILVIGALSGWGFRTITRQYYRMRPVAAIGHTYGMDLAGAILGALLISAVLIPVWGVPVTLLFLMLSAGILLI